MNLLLCLTLIYPWLDLYLSWKLAHGIISFIHNLFTHFSQNDTGRLLFLIRDGPFDIQGGGWDFFEKNSLFPMRCEKNKMSSTKLKINSLFFIH